MSETPAPAASDSAVPADTGGRASSFSLDVERRTIPNAIQGYWGRFRTGDPGALPSVLGLIVLAIIFSQVSGRFLTRSNIGNLPGQASYIAVIALGLVFVLLLGEIDLSAGTTGGLCAGFAAQAIFSDGLHKGVPSALYWILIASMLAAAALGVWLKTYSGPVVSVLGVLIIAFGLDKHVVFAMLLAIAIGSTVGIFTGALVARLGIPSFIVTLALFLAWQGVLLFAIDSQSKGVTNYDFWNGLANDNMSPLWSWVFTIVMVGGYTGFTLLKSIRAQARGLAADTIELVLLRAGIIAAAAIVITVLANQNRSANQYVKTEGLPWAATIAVTLMVICTIALTKTSWGRHLFATGGNAEAARRAGIDVVKIKVTAFTLCSSFGALGGLFYGSTTHSIDLAAGGGNTLLFAVAAAVIGGTSLFGGRGKPRDAIIGALVIVIIPNGLGLKPNLGPQYQQVITGAVLLVAAAVDAVSRRRTR
jgi:D-xylose transport system permease protein